MKQYLHPLFCAALSLSLLAGVSGCQTYGEAVGAGAGLGALAGGIIGHQSGNALEGAAIGAALGAAGGAIVHDVKVREQRSAQQTAVTYDYQPQRGMELHAEDASVLPSTVHPGQLIEASIQYALLGADQGVSVRETRTLLRGERLIAGLADKKFTRSSGTWVSTLPFELPRGLQPGIYTLRQDVYAGELHIFRAIDFNVTAH